MSKLFVILFIIAMHILEDFHLQGILASMKQKSWWSDNYNMDLLPFSKCKYDYVVALIVHGLEWSFFIMLPIAIYNHFQINLLFVGFFILNSIVHASLDNQKCNMMIINLIEDQIFHCIQIAATIFIWMNGLI